MKKFTLFLAVAASLSLAVTSCSKKSKSTDVKGCKDVNAANYNKDATVDDGSCVLPDLKQRALIMDISGLWCGPCGSFGIPGFRYAVAQLGAKAIPMSVHVNDKWDYSCSKEIYHSSMYFGTGPDSGAVPRFTEGTSVLLTGAYTDSSATASVLVTPANSTYLKKAVANSYVKATVDEANETVNLDIKTKFFQAAKGEYYVTAYFLRNNVVAPQYKSTTGAYDNNQVHEHVLMGCFTNSAFGDNAMVTGDVAANATFSTTLSQLYDPAWPLEDVNVAVIIWKKTADKVFAYENGTIIKLK